ncbi:MAG: hypothetical protein M0R77_21350 [Gammaproteobacteria bacterium]|nr:hypothetical protein [Gammaproteobacteria bacterium]
MKKMLTLKNILIAIGIIILDISVYVFFGLMLMNYEDFYNESKGAFWSLESMTLTEKFYYIGFEIWNVLNLIAVGYIIFRIIKGLRKRPTTNILPSGGRNASV